MDKPSMKLEQICAEVANQRVPSPSDFCVFVPWACRQFILDYYVVVTRNQLIDPSTKMHHLSRSTTKSRGTPCDSEIICSKTQSALPVTSTQAMQNTISLTAVYEGENNLITVRILKNKKIPRTLLKIIDMTLPFHPYLNAIVFDRADQAIVHEVSNLLRHSNITEVYLDGTYVPQANYHVLLDCPNCKVLSLSMCTITDIVVRTIADKLDIGTTGAENLVVLNLSTNRITDIGAKYLAGMLRTNRNLFYLNLSGNQISDDGARSLLEVLSVFPLTEEEVYSSLQRHGAFKTKELQLVVNLLNDPTFIAGFVSGNQEKKETPRKSPKGRLNQKHMSVESLKKSKSKTSTSTVSKLAQANIADQDRTIMLERAYAVVKCVVGRYIDPFSQSNTTLIDGVMHCHGNNSLRCLNLAYNDLTYLSVPRILDVLAAQRNIYDNPGGLLNIRIEGNFMPETCLEYHNIDEILDDVLTISSMSKKILTKNKSTLKSKKNTSAGSMK